MVRNDTYQTINTKKEYANTPVSILQTYRNRIRKVFDNKDINYESLSKESKELTEKEIIDTNTLIEETFFSAYEDTLKIRENGTEYAKSELERILKNMSGENLSIKIYNHTKNSVIKYDELKRSIYNAYWAGSITADKNPNLKPKEQLEKYIMMTEE